VTLSTFQEFNLVVAIPHSGRDITLSKELGCNHWSLEDHTAFADPFLDVLAPVFETKAKQTVIQHVSRSLIDMNRCPFDHNLTPKIRCSCPPQLHREHVGLGLMPRRSGQNTWLHREACEETITLAQQIHKNFHRKIQDALSTNSAQKPALLLDIHSMPDSAANGYDICIGNRHNESASPEITKIIVDAISSSFGHHKIGINTPFSGFYTAARHGKPAMNTHVIQIEFNRKLTGLDKNSVSACIPNVASFLDNI